MRSKTKKSSAKVRKLREEHHELLAADVEEDAIEGRGSDESEDSVEEVGAAEAAATRTFIEDVMGSTDEEAGDTDNGEPAAFA